MCTTTQAGTPATTTEQRHACQGSCDASAKSQCGSSAQAASTPSAAPISLTHLRSAIKPSADSKE